MKKYYINFERQSCDLGTIVVEAENEIEAKGKALEVAVSLVSGYYIDVYTHTEKPTSIEILLNEDGEEVDLDNMED